ncbi:26S proteasome non-ATPase regulatory subunit 14 [Strongyloides ratti]|uniref:26S proteasome non-ATPase regulatory subunit 14 n=1 Tax=Strongyloides ratti TaxID=34506 RepID=A0A090L701_STRRB|nr:26S proteasome non-ATPase regulatory subunit 14 [Strongyloides ratti]CEF65517.1 26S proteasome non-ATPase regulatory subunit 14 [Strongyloides ratti]
MDTALLNLLLKQQEFHNGAPKLPLDRPNQPDTCESIYISPLATMKMLKHAKSGIPMEVMGLILGQFVDEYTIKVTDVFGMPQKASTATVECIDPAYQLQMLEKLRLTKRDDEVVGWYHSHPGYGCWLSRIDINTQKSFEALNPRSIAIVVDPIQSVRGMISLDAFRSKVTSPKSFDSMKDKSSNEPRQITSNVGKLTRHIPFSIRAEIMESFYYKVNVIYTLTETEKKTLQACTRKSNKELSVFKYSSCEKENKELLKNLIKISDRFIDEQKPSMSKNEEEVELNRYGNTVVKEDIIDAATKIMINNSQNCAINALTCNLKIMKQ